MYQQMLWSSSWMLMVLRLAATLRELVWIVVVKGYYTSIFPFNILLALEY
jgi:hypothetical protein